MKKLIIGIVAIILVIIIGVFAWYNGSLKPVSKLPVEENELIRVEIEKGLGTNQIAKVFFSFLFLSRFPLIPQTGAS